MAKHVCNLAGLMCDQGLAPGVLMVLPLNKMLTSFQPAANIMDNKPMVNIMPFGMCKSPANPTVAAATAAALGTLTPMPCVPLIPAPWTPGAAKTNLAAQPMLDDSSTLKCAYGGTITVKSPGQGSENIP